MNLFGWRKNGQKEAKTSIAICPTMERDLRKKLANLLLTMPEICNLKVCLQMTYQLAQYLNLIDEDLVVVYFAFDDGFHSVETP